MAMAFAGPRAPFGCCCPPPRAASSHPRTVAGSNSAGLAPPSLLRRLAPWPLPSAPGKKLRGPVPVLARSPSNPGTDTGGATWHHGRRGLLAGIAVASAISTPSSVAQAAQTTAEALQEKALIAFNNREFGDAIEALTALIELQPGELGWVEGRAQVLLDSKDFVGSLRDYDAALAQATAAGDTSAEARLCAGKALANEGLGEWEAALADYDRSLALAAAAGYQADPYVLNSRGNCLASLGRWADARAAYKASAEGFAGSRLRDRYGSMRPRQEGYLQAASNSALSLAELGDREGAIEEMERLVRREPGSVDMRAALASLYWEEGRQQAAEDIWAFACEKVDVGCQRYKDLDWLARIRRWPPGMVERMRQFLAIA